MGSIDQKPSKDSDWNGEDRRSEPTPLFSRYSLWGRRRKNTRPGDPSFNYNIDRPELAYLLMLLAVVLLVAFDALATWIFIHQGGEEGNPFVAWFLSLGPLAFWTLKLAPLPLMVVYFASKRFFLWSRLLAYTLLLVYTALAGFHIYGIWSVWHS